MPPDPDLLAAELAAIRELVAERGRLLALVMNLDAAGRDVGKLEAAERGLAAWAPRLLAAVEAALKPHQPGRRVVLGSLCEGHAEHRYFSTTSTEAADVMACPDCKADVYESCTGCGTPVSVDKCAVRAVITRKLLGEAPNG